MRLSGDERQRQIAAAGDRRRGRRHPGLLYIGGAIVDLARAGTGNPGALICAAGGLSYVIAFAIMGA